MNADALMKKMAESNSWKLKSNTTEGKSVQKWIGNDTLAVRVAQRSIVSCLEQVFGFDDEMEHAFDHLSLTASCSVLAFVAKNIFPDAKLEEEVKKVIVGSKMVVRGASPTVEPPPAIATSSVPTAAVPVFDVVEFSRAVSQVAIEAFTRGLSQQQQTQQAQTSTRQRRARCPGCGFSGYCVCVQSPPPRTRNAPTVAATTEPVAETETVEDEEEDEDPEEEQEIAGESEAIEESPLEENPMEEATTTSSTLPVSALTNAGLLLDKEQWQDLVKNFGAFQVISALERYYSSVTSDRKDLPFIHDILVSACEILASSKNKHVTESAKNIVQRVITRLEFFRAVQNSGVEAAAAGENVMLDIALPASIRAGRRATEKRAGELKSNPKPSQKGSNTNAATQGKKKG
jgi:hypothetical protein